MQINTREITHWPTGWKIMSHDHLGVVDIETSQTSLRITGKRVVIHPLQRCDDRLSIRTGKEFREIGETVLNSTIGYHVFQNNRLIPKEWLDLAKAKGEIKILFLGTVYEKDSFSFSFAQDLQSRYGFGLVITSKPDGKFVISRENIYLGTKSPRGYAGTEIEGHCYVATIQV